MHWVLLIAFAMIWLPLILLLLGSSLWNVREEETLEAEGSSSGASLGEGAPFFVQSGAEDRSEDLVEERTVIWLEDYLRAEHEQAERFVTRPSVGNLYKNCE